MEGFRCGHEGMASLRRRGRRLSRPSRRDAIALESLGKNSRLVILTQSANEVVDITERVGALIGSAPGGNCHLYLRHTTAGLMVVTSESGVSEDIMDILQTLTPKLAYRHDSQAHVAAHFLSALVGPSVNVPVRDVSSHWASFRGSF